MTAQATQAIASEVSREVCEQVESILKLCNLQNRDRSVWHLLEKNSPEYKEVSAILTEKGGGDAAVELETFATNIRAIAGKITCIATYRLVPGERPPYPETELEAAKSLSCLMKACELVHAAHKDQSQYFKRTLNTSLNQTGEITLNEYASATLNLFVAVEKAASLSATSGQSISEQLLIGEVQETLREIGRYNHDNLPTFRRPAHWTDQQVDAVNREREDIIVRQVAERVEKAYTSSRNSTTPTSFVSEFEKLRGSQPNELDVGETLGLTLRPT